jgi:hydrogenase maturation protein HypF
MATAMENPAPVARKHVQVRGIVQGVGFRPFVYNLARSLDLRGYVFNSSAGVTIEVEGISEDIDQFLLKLESDVPQLAELTDVTVSTVQVRGGTGFTILHSRHEASEFVLISPDAGTCEACWRDFGDPTNRRFGYAFTNCTHCGPRYTIIEDTPYDRATTTMSHFTMCAACQAEYENPTNRRFHAQPNACPLCGPSLCLVPRGTALPDCKFKSSQSLPSIRKARALLREGKILAIKGLGGFLLACDATNHAAVAELRKRKHRPAKPFALMMRDIASVKKFCEVSPADEIALLHLRRPIVVLPRLPDTPLSASLAPGNHTIGVMLPYTPLHYLLFSDSASNDAGFHALVMTSGNLSEEPIVISNDEALTHLDGIADWFLLHNRDIATRVDDSVVRTFEGRERVLRRSRGFVPQAIDLEIPMQEILAFGGELKNTFCLTKDRYAILSQHIGDLENFETMQFFEETLVKMKHLFKVEPQAIAHDLHPGYMSTRMALASPVARKIGVQHHHAHIASCMAENRLQGQVIGVAFDGTGYGADGRIWGGEFLVADYAGFIRAAHLRNVLLPGSDAAVRQPWRMALSYLRDTFGDQWPRALPCFQNIPGHQIRNVDSMITRRFNTVETSSCGRLFDAIAAILGLATEVTFEGQAAIALEAATTQSERHYDFSSEDGEPSIIDLRPMISAVVSDISQHTKVAEISTRFHNTISLAIVETCSRIRKNTGLNRVCLSGGSFQNVYVLHRTVQNLRACGFGVFLHSVVPANDGGIALGQAVVANALLQRGD